MTITFRCGHSVSVPREVAAAPACGTCGERVVSRVEGAIPRFVGACRGPYAETKAVDADNTVLVANRLKLKQE